MKKSSIFLFVLFCFSIAMFAQVGINTDNSIPETSSMLDVKSTNKGLLPPRMSAAQRNTIASPAEGLVIYNTDHKALNVYDGMSWKSIFPSQPFICGLTISITHLVSGGVAPVNKTVAYGTIAGIPGGTTNCWITNNLGSHHQATAVNDATEAAAGWYWQFNRKQGYKHDGTTRIPNSVWITNISESSEWTTANDPCTIELGAGWRIPTSTDWFNVNATGGWTTWNGPFDSELKLHAAGYLYYSVGSIDYRGTYGYSWSSTQSGSTNGWYLGFNNNSSGVSSNNKAYGFTLRCLREN